MTDLPAGEELDRMVARLIMKDENYKLYRGDQWNPDPWSPSKMIADAWEVVERMRSLGWFFHLQDMRDRTFVVHFAADGRATVGDYHSTSAPLAICRAAIQAMEAG